MSRKNSLNPYRLCFAPRGAGRIKTPLNVHQWLKTRALIVAWPQQLLLRKSLTIIISENIKLVSVSVYQLGLFYFETIDEVDEEKDIRT